MSLMLNHQDSPYIRAIGFLYLRYTCDPPQLFKWFEPYLFDDEPIQVRASKKAVNRGGSRGGEHDTDNTIGTFVRSLLSSTSREYCGTMLPRLPIQIERDIQVSILQAEKIQKRAETHFRNKKTMETFQKLGSSVMATYEDEENPLTWYRAEVDRVVLRGEDGQLLKHPKFVVTFTEYGNTETVTLGEMDLPEGQFYKEDQARGRSEDRGHDDRRGGRSDDLYDEVRKRERDTVTASGRDYYSRPPTTKKSLAAPSGRAPPPDRSRRPGRSPSPPRAERRRVNQGEREDDKVQQKSPPRKRTPEEVAAVQAKKRKLMAKYG